MIISRNIVITGFLMSMMAILAGFVSSADQNDYVIDTLIVVDDVMYNSWRSRLSPDVTDPDEIAQKIREYVALVVHQANKRLETIRRHASLGVQMQVVDTQVNKAVLAFVPTNILTGRIRAEVALDLFHDWVLDQRLQANYDHFMLLTGTAMESVYEGMMRESVRGRAHIGTVCDTLGRSVSLVQDSGGFQSVHVVAHELAHNVGAYHDGEAGAEACRETDRYLMSANSQGGSDDDSEVMRRNPWYMSTCSADAIQTRISEVIQSRSNCLNTKSEPAAEFTLAANIIPGQAFDAPEQCKMLYGQESTLCLGASFSSWDGICTRMFCSKTVSSCAQHYAAEGTSCGNKKWCQMGQCVESQEAPQMDDCPYGDTALARSDGASCADYVTRFPSACYRDNIREICCQSCAEIHTGKDVCPYGDKRVGCTADVCEQVYPNGTLLAELCCATCNYTGPRECRDVVSIDGLPCLERVGLNIQQECYNGTVAFHCCETCSRQRQDVTGCEYGDLFTGGYCQSKAGYDNLECDNSLKSVCCQTCDRAGFVDPDSGSRLVLNLLLNLLPLLIVIHVIQ